MKKEKYYGTHQISKELVVTLLCWAQTESDFELNERINCSQLFLCDMSKIEVIKSFMKNFYKFGCITSTFTPTECYICV